LELSQVDSEVEDLFSRALLDQSDCGMLLRLRMPRWKECRKVLKLRKFTSNERGEKPLEPGQHLPPPRRSRCTNGGMLQKFRSDFLLLLTSNSEECKVRKERARAE
jgi:hypothetical protein